MKRNNLKKITFAILFVIIFFIINIIYYHFNSSFEKNDILVEYFLYERNNDAYYIAVDNYGNMLVEKGKFDEHVYDIIAYKGTLNDKFIEGGIKYNKKIDWVHFNLIKHYLKQIKREAESVRNVTELRTINYMTDRSKSMIIKADGYYYNVDKILLYSRFDGDNKVSLVIKKFNKEIFGSASIDSY